ncbi:MAG: tRNA 5-hydroxyuridine modification protein YegQ, partial [Gammaproteobacteria bacterium]|nr:tRNA 5-hydroxyuridine modification protein YegQ [Gammaproteobacteria bacterium]
FAYGADAVYAGMPRYSLRVRNNEFDLANLEIGINEAHALGKQLFLASNVLPHNAKVKTYMADMEAIVGLGPDALIMADPGLIMLVRERWPELPVHLSVQANTMNYATVKFWQQLGIKRVILSRELSLDEVEEIRQQCPEMELEVFVHGALCIAYSGRCLLSGYFNHRDPNQGSCTNSCRWDYKTIDTTTDVNGDVQPVQQAQPVLVQPEKVTPGACGDMPRREEADKTYLLEEANRPGELMPIEEDEHGTYIMNSKDLRAVEHINRLVEIGVDSLKIEGRTKSYYYVARTAQIYRQAIDDAVAGRGFDMALLGKLENLANRGYTDGFYERHHTQDHQNYMQGNSLSNQQQFVGDVVGYDKEKGQAEINVKNKFSVGDSLELILPSGNREVIVTEMENLRGEAMQVAPGSGHQVRIPLPEADYEMALLARNL